MLERPGADPFTDGTCLRRAAPHVVGQHSTAGGGVPEVMTDGRRLRHLYDRAIAGCRQGDEWLAGGAMLELIATLNFEYEGAAAALFRIYDRCLADIRRGRFEESMEMLQALRASLDVVTGLSEQAPAPGAPREW